MTVLNFRHFIAIHFKKMTAAGILLPEQSFLNWSFLLKHVLSLIFNAWSVYSSWWMEMNNSLLPFYSFCLNSRLLGDI